MVKLSAVLKPKDTRVVAMSFSTSSGIHTDVESLGVQLVENAQALVAHHGNQAVDFLLPAALQQLIGQVHFLDHVVFVNPADMERIDPGCLPEHAAGSGIQSFRHPDSERHEPAVGVALRVQQAVKAVANTDHFPAQLVCSLSRTLDHGIHPGDEAGSHH